MLYVLLIYKGFSDGHDAQVRDGVESGFGLIVEFNGVELFGLPLIHIFCGLDFQAFQVGNPVGQSLLPFLVVRMYFALSFTFSIFICGLPFLFDFTTLPDCYNWLRCVLAEGR